MQTPTTSSATELPSASQGEDGAGRKPRRRGILVGAALGMLIEAPPEIGKLKRAFEQTSAHAVNVVSGGRRQSGTK